MHILKILVMGNNKGKTQHIEQLCHFILAFTLGSPLVF